MSRTARPVGELTPREIEALRYVSSGMTTKAIASQMFLSHHTVGDHIRNGYRKLGVHNRVMAVMEAIRRGIIA